MFLKFYLSIIGELNEYFTMRFEHQTPSQKGHHIFIQLVVEGWGSQVTVFSFFSPLKY